MTTTEAAPASTPSVAPSSAPSSGEGSSGAPSSAPSTPSAPPVSSSGAPISQRLASEFLEGTSGPKSGHDPFSDKPAADPFGEDEVEAPAESPDASAETPATETPDATPEPELTAVPFKYTADGQEVAFDGIEEIPGEGALVSAEALPKLRDQLQRADHYGKQVQQYGQVIERFQKVGGFERMEQLEANAAVLQAVGAKFLEILAEDGPKTEEGYQAALAELATDPRARALMLRELDVLTRSAEMDARGKFKGALQGVERAGQEAGARGQAMQGAVQEMGRAIKQTFGVDLAPEDLAEANEVFSQFADSIYRPATAQEAAALRVPVGSPIIDYPKMHPWFTARAQQRSREAQLRTASTAATADNTARLAATTPTRPATTRAATQRPGTGTKANAPRPDRPEITDWKMRMRMGLSPIPNAPANP